MSTLLFPVAFAEGSAPGPLLQLVPFIVIFAIFYFFLIAPMRRRQKALQTMIANLKKGDKVVTTGGLHGEVAALRDEVVVLRVAENVKVRVSRSAIAGLEGEEKAGGSK